MGKDKVKRIVKESYGKIARERASCCGPAASCCGMPNAAAQRGYGAGEVAGVPEGADLGLRCGNPIAFASLQPGDTVLDLGSGAGFDCFIAATKVGPGGKVIGVDMTPEMVEQARENARISHFDNVEFRLGEIENLPLRDGEVDVVISNCVINLSPEKEKVFREAFRVLKPGGRLIVSDIVSATELPQSVKRSTAAYIACVAGAATREEYINAITKAGFEQVKIASEMIISGCCPTSDPIVQALSADPSIPPHDLQKVASNIRSITIRAVKPRR